VFTSAGMGLRDSFGKKPVCHFTPDILYLELQELKPDEQELTPAFA